MTTDNTSIFLINPDDSMIIYGSLYILFSTPVLPLEVIVMMALHTKEKSAKNATFKLMNLINILEIGHVICHFVSSFFLFFPLFAIQFEVFVRVIGSILNTFWIAEIPLMALLAVSRIFIFRGLHSTFLSVIARLILFLITSWMSFVLITGAITQNFMFYPPSWQYDVTAKYASIFVKLEIITVISSLAIAYFSYLVIIYLIYMKKQVALSTSRRSNEKSILYQYTFTVTYILIYLVLWHSGNDLFNIQSPTALALINCFWIGGAYISPVTLVIFNNAIRRECRRVIRCKSDSKVSITWVTPNT